MSVYLLWNWRGNKEVDEIKTSVSSGLFLSGVLTWGLFVGSKALCRSVASCSGCLNDRIPDDFGGLYTHRGRPATPQRGGVRMAPTLSPRLSLHASLIRQYSISVGCVIHKARRTVWRGYTQHYEWWKKQYTKNVYIIRTKGGSKKGTGESRCCHRVGIWRMLGKTSNASMSLFEILNVHKMLLYWYLSYWLFRIHYSNVII